MTNNHPTTTPAARAAFNHINKDGWTLCAVNPDKKPAGSWSVGGSNRYNHTNSDQLYTNPSHAYGIITGPSGIIIIDLDNNDAIRAWANRNGTPTTRIANTPRGRHLYYLAPVGVELAPSVSLMPGVDVRAGESYAIIPPSVTSGGEYSWANDAPIEPLPADILEQLRDKRSPEKAHIPSGEPIPQGKRNDELWHRALRVVRAGLSREAVYGAIRAEAETYAEGDLKDEELKGIVQSAFDFNERKGSAAEQTIDEIITIVNETDTPALAASLDELDISMMMLTDPPPIEWVWEGYLASGTLNLLHGDAGLGKSLISLAIAEACTRSRLVLNRETCSCDVAIIDAENSRDEIHRRIKQTDADPARVHYYRTDESILGHRAVTAELFAHIHKQTGATLYILDSQRALWDGDEREQGEAGRMLRYLARIAEALSICILVIHHDTKAGQYSGSSDISAALTGSRLHLTRASKKDDPDGEEWKQRKLVHAKCRIGAEQPVETFIIEMTAGIELRHAGPTSNLDYIARLVTAFAREHEAWPTIPMKDIHDEISEMKDRRIRAQVYQHLDAIQAIETAPKHGSRTVTFASQSSL